MESQKPKLERLVKRYGFTGPQLEVVVTSAVVVVLTIPL